MRFARKLQSSPTFRLNCGREAVPGALGASRRFAARRGEDSQAEQEEVVRLSPLLATDFEVRRQEGHSILSGMGEQAKLLPR